MTYYILPNHNNNISINLICDNKKSKLDIYISYSLHNFYYTIKNQLINLCKCVNVDENDNVNNKDVLINDFEEIVKIINPCEYIFSNVPGNICSVSKIKPQTNSFYDFFEIINILNIYENYKNIESNFLYISPNYIDIIKHSELYREKNNNDVILGFNKISNINNSLIDEKPYKFNFIFIEPDSNEFVDTQSYVINLINILKFILKYQNKNGISIIKIDHVFYKPIIDILYIFSSIFENILIIKPTSCNIATFEKYIICKNYLFNDKDKIIDEYYLKIVETTNKLKNNLNNISIMSLVDTEIPCYFINKLNDINIAFGQQQIESLYQIINILKNKNKEEKIEIIKKNNIQKSINWCEKYQIPFNKFLDKNNIFLSTIKESIL
jgi:hypothetical protein